MKRLARASPISSRQLLLDAIARAASDGQIVFADPRSRTICMMTDCNSCSDMVMANPDF